MQVHLGAESHPLIPRTSVPEMSPGINRSFPRLSRSPRQVTYVLLPLTPLEYPLRGLSARLACLIHAANVRSEPGSNPSIGCFSSVAIATGCPATTPQRTGNPQPGSSGRRPEGPRPNPTAVREQAVNAESGRFSPSPRKARDKSGCGRSPPGLAKAEASTSHRLRWLRDSELGRDSRPNLVRRLTFTGSAELSKNNRKAKLRADIEKQRPAWPIQAKEILPAIRELSSTSLRHFLPPVYSFLRCLPANTNTPPARRWFALPQPDFWSHAAAQSQMPDVRCAARTGSSQPNGAKH